MKLLATNLAGSIVEAWQEVRIHKTRVMLSLIGVAVAVCALTTVVGLGTVAEAASIQQQERDGGRPANLSMSAYTQDGSPAGTEKVEAVWREALDRYDITYASRLVQSQQTVQFADGAVATQVQGVDVPFGTMRRFQLEEGRWFTEDDAERLAPAVIVNSVFYDRIGRPDLATHPTASLLGQQDTTAVIIGVYAASMWEEMPAMYMLADSLASLPAGVGITAGPPDGSQFPTGSGSYEMWVPPAIAEELRVTLERDLQAALGDGAQAGVNRTDWATWGTDGYLQLKLIVGGVAVLVLLLGALGLVNIALVSLRQRIREIGIRRSFGATAGRVFFAVMMESVVATVVAGIFGVIVAILIVKNPIVEDFISQGQVSDFPPFPIEAALLGLAAATIVGALAGLLPALVAVRVKVIDAIRY
jgi:putative ABC transport system permease protein